MKAGTGNYRTAVCLSVISFLHLPSFERGLGLGLALSLCRIRSSGWEGVCVLHSVGWKVEAWPGSLQVWVCLAVGT